MRANQRRGLILWRCEPKSFYPATDGQRMIWKRPSTINLGTDKQNTITAAIKLVWDEVGLADAGDEAGNYAEGRAKEHGDFCSVEGDVALRS